MIKTAEKIPSGSEDLIFYPYFRSWDLWAGFSANLAAIQLLKEYMAKEIGCKDGNIVAYSKGLHIYGHAFEMAEIRTYYTAQVASRTALMEKRRAELEEDNGSR